MNCCCLTCGKKFYQRPSRIKSGRGKFCSQSCLGKSRIGEKNGKWKGDKVGYIGLHHRVRKSLGKPLICQFCGVTDVPIEWANKSHKYFLTLSDWISLCVPCHRKYDNTPRIRKRKSKFAKEQWRNRIGNKIGKLLT